MASGEGRKGRPVLITLLIVLAAVVLLADQVSKTIVLHTLTAGEYRPLLGDFLGFSLVFNPGAAFSLGEGSTWLFTIAMVVVTVAILWVSRRLGSRGWAVALGALLGGTLGNLGDRLFRDPGFAVGHVVDFINYNGWFVGNIADIAIVLSAAGIAVLSFAGVGLNGQRVAAENDGEASEGRHVASGEDDEGEEGRGASTDEAGGDASEETGGMPATNADNAAGTHQDTGADEDVTDEDAAGEEVTRTDG